MDAIKSLEHLLSRKGTLDFLPSLRDFASLLRTFLTNTSSEIPRYSPNRGTSILPRQNVFIAMNAPKVIGSLMSGIIATLPTSEALPLRLHIRYRLLHEEAFFDWRINPRQYRKGYFPILYVTRPKHNGTIITNLSWALSCSMEYSANSESLMLASLRVVSLDHPPSR